MSTEFGEKWEWCVKFLPISVKFAYICCKHAADIVKSDQNGLKVLMIYVKILANFGQIYAADILKSDQNRVNCTNRSSNLTKIGQIFCFKALFVC